MNTINKFLIFLLFQTCSVFAGTIRGNNLNMSVGKEYLADGQMIAANEIKLKCGQVFKGEGLMKAPVIDIKTKKFEFTGTIECDQTCTITVQEPFDESQFKRLGQGQFTIIIDENLDLENEDPKVTTPTFSPILRTPPQVARAIFDRQSVPERNVEKGGITFNFKGERMLELVDAVEKNDIVAVKALLNDNLSIKEDTEQLTILMLIAGLSGHLEVANEFIKLGANINGTDSKYGRGTPHLITAVLGNNEFAKLLIESGAQVNEDDSYWRTALHYAANNGHVDTVAALIQAGADVDKSDQKRLTPLMYAADKGHVEVVRALLNAGADKDKKDLNWLKAINYVNPTEQKELFDLLNEKVNVPAKEMSSVNYKVSDNTEQSHNGFKEVAQSFFNKPISYMRIGQAAFLGTILACIFYKDAKRALNTWF